MVERLTGPEPIRGMRPASSEGLGGSGGDVTGSATAAAAILAIRLNVGGLAAVDDVKEGVGGVMLTDISWIYNDVCKQTR